MNRKDFFTPEDLDEVQKKFHAHLDVCWTCRNRPFSLCSIGITILEKGPRFEVKNGL